MPAAVETMVRMGELAVSKTPGDVLVSIGLGSCIGLALLDPARSLAGLAHVMLPAANGDAASHGKFADLAVPALLEQLLRLGARRTAVQATLVGGAQMFSFSAASNLDVGARNERATREALQQAGIPVKAAATGGGKGRTVRVHTHGVVVCKEAGGAEVELYRGAAA